MVTLDGAENYIALIAAVLSTGAMIFAGRQASSAREQAEAARDQVGEARRQVAAAESANQTAQGALREAVLMREIAASQLEEARRQADAAKEANEIAALSLDIQREQHINAQLQKVRLLPGKALLTSSASTGPMGIAIPQAMATVDIVNDGPNDIQILSLRASGSAAHALEGIDHGDIELLLAGNGYDGAITVAIRERKTLINAGEYLDDNGTFLVRGVLKLTQTDQEVNFQCMGFMRQGTPVMQAVKLSERQAGRPHTQW